MRIAIILLNQGRGSGVVAKEHGAFLLNDGHKVYFLHPKIGRGLPGAFNRDIQLGNKVMPVHEYLPAAQTDQKAVSTMGYQEASAYLPAYESALLDIIQDVDIVIGHHANLTAIATANVCRAHQKPFVLFLHGTGIEPRHHGGYDNQIWDLIVESVSQADGIMVTTNYVRDQLVRNLIDIPMERFHIQACGVDITEFHSGNTGSIREKYHLPEQYVICPGALTQAKGPQNIVEASQYYADLAETIFIGGGNLRSELEGRLAGRGRFLGFVSNEDKAQLINAATILTAAPEKKEHFGIIYAEAMAAGVPAVAYEGGGVNSIITRETGILTERDPVLLGKAIRSLLENPEQRKSMAEKSRERATLNYSTELLGPKLAAWLYTLAQV